MTVENFFISTAFRIGDFVKYFSYPFFKMGAIAVTKNERRSDLVAGGAAALTYGGLTAHYSGMELENYDRLVRMAYAAEKGVDPQSVRCSDYLDSDNPIISKRAELATHLMKVRYGTSTLPLLPSVIDHLLDFTPKALQESIQKWRSSSKPKQTASALEHVMYGYKVDNHAVYAGFAALWIYEQFIVKKTGIYDASKVMETKQDVGRQVSCDDLLGIYNRGREDGGRPMIFNKNDLNELRKPLQCIADKINHNNKFDLTEAIYLLGLDKINPFKKDAQGNEIIGPDGNRIVDSRKMQEALAEIDLVDKIGLQGVIESKISKQPIDKPQFTKRVGKEKRHSDTDRTLLDLQYGFAKRFTPDVLHPGEDISGRDPIR